MNNDFLSQLRQVLQSGASKSLDAQNTPAVVPSEWAADPAQPAPELYSYWGHVLLTVNATSEDGLQAFVAKRLALTGLSFDVDSWDVEDSEYNADTDEYDPIRYVVDVTLRGAICASYGDAGSEWADKFFAARLDRIGLEYEICSIQPDDIGHDD